MQFFFVAIFKKKKGGKEPCKNNINLKRKTGDYSAFG